MLLSLLLLVAFLADKTPNQKDKCAVKSKIHMNRSEKSNKIRNVHIHTFIYACSIRRLPRLRLNSHCGPQSRIK